MSIFKKTQKAPEPSSQKSTPSTPQQRTSWTEYINGKPVLHTLDPQQGSYSITQTHQPKKEHER